MSSESPNLSLLARSKLHLSISGKDSCSLHRWVLLKNSIVRSPSQNHSTYTTTSQPEVNSAFNNDDGEEDDDAEEVLGFVGTDAFMFPDAGQLVSAPASSGTQSSEAQWLDSLLETLGDDDDDDDFHPDSDHQNSSLAVDDDEFPLYSPSVSPMSSSDSLHHQPAYFPSSVSVPYPVPYPPYQSPFLHAFPFDSSLPSLVSSVPAPYEVPLPYHDEDDLENLQVPDAIEDTSDDESDAPTTPSLGRSSSSLSLVDAASIPLPPDRSRLRHASPRVYNSDDSYFYSLDIDPLPFPVEQFHTSYNHYQQC
jgi:hypothetical protein